MSTKTYLERAMLWVESDSPDDDLIKTTLNRFNAQITLARSSGRNAEVNDLEDTVEFLLGEIEAGNPALPSPTLKPLAPAASCHLDTSILVDHHQEPAPQISVVEKNRILEQLKSHPNLISGRLLI